VNAKVGFEPVTTPVWVFCAESNCGIRTRDGYATVRIAATVLSTQLLKRLDDGRVAASAAAE